jgi:hypothetical protein
MTFKILAGTLSTYDLVSVRAYRHEKIKYGCTVLSWPELHSADTELAGGGGGGVVMT